MLHTTSTHNATARSLTLLFAVLSFSACGTTTSAGGAGTATDAVSGDSAGGLDTSSTADTPSNDAQADAATTDVPGVDAEKSDVPVADVTTSDAQTSDTTATDVASAQDTATASGGCTNAADEKILAGGTVEKATTDCALQSMGDSAKASACMQKATGLSDGCTACFGGILSCTFKNCIGSCMGGKTPACDKCMIDKGCNAEFTTCAGVSP